jgi:hypothetical protein
VTRERKNIRRIRALGAEGTEPSREHKLHNHPSGVKDQSQADELITKRVSAALALIDVRVLDHLIFAGDSVLSFAEIGLI